MTSLVPEDRTGRPIVYFALPESFNTKSILKLWEIDNSNPCYFMWEKVAAMVGNLPRLMKLTKKLVPKYLNSLNSQTFQKLVEELFALLNKYYKSKVVTLPPADIIWATLFRETIPMTNEIRVLLRESYIINSINDSNIKTSKTTGVITPLMSPFILYWVLSTELQLGIRSRTDEIKLKRKYIWKTFQNLNNILFNVETLNRPRSDYLEKVCFPSILKIRLDTLCFNKINKTSIFDLLGLTSTDISFLNHEFKINSESSKIFHLSFCSNKSNETEDFINELNSHIVNEDIQFRVLMAADGDSFDYIIKIFINNMIYYVFIDLKSAKENAETHIDTSLVKNEVQNEQSDEQTEEQYINMNDFVNSMHKNGYQYNQTQAFVDNNNSKLHDCSMSYVYFTTYRKEDREMGNLIETGINSNRYFFSIFLDYYRAGRFAIASEEERNSSA